MFRKYFLVFLLLTAPAARAEEAIPICGIDDRPCILRLIEITAVQIDNPNWRDQTYRELAKTWASDGEADVAIALLAKIENPDTKAMTIRGIGMAAAENEWDRARYNGLFARLRAEAEKIEHPPSYAIALTYIAMAQAFAGDNEGAWATAADMENDALRHKAYGETAEIQAEKGDFAAAMTSIAQIDSEAFRNKAYSTVSKIFAESEHLDDALQAALMITNPYKKAESLQFVMDTQKPRELPH